MLILMRHAECPPNELGCMTSRTDCGLSPTGHLQTQQVLNANKHVFFDQVVASPLRRAQETAAPFMTKLERRVPRLTAPFTDPLLRELDFGLFEGKRGVDLAQGPHQDMYHAWTRGETVDNGGETWDSLADRCHRVLITYAPNRPGQIPTLLVTHGYVIRMMACLLLHAPFASIASLRIDNTRMMVIDHERGRLKMVGFNVPVIPMN